MKNENEFSVRCTEMGPHQASISYTGLMCQAGAMALEYQIDRLFGYYKYMQVTLAIESPGGALDGLEYVLRSMRQWALEGRHVAVQTTFQCASAAAFLLAMGRWGHRRADRSTFLLFHSARVESAGMGMTAAYSTNLSHALNSVDRKLLDVIVNKMLSEADGAKGLVEIVLSRMRFVDQNWKQLAADIATFTTGADGNRKPDWLKAVQKWTRLGGDPQKFVLEMKKHLHQRLQRDDRMHLLEAYVLCLIDEISGVVDANSSVTEPCALQVFVEQLPLGMPDESRRTKPKEREETMLDTSANPMTTG